MQGSRLATNGHESSRIAFSFVYIRVDSWLDKIRGWTTFRRKNIMDNHFNPRPCRFNVVVGTVIAVASLACFGATSLSAEGFPRPKIFHGEGLGSAAVAGWDYDVNGDGLVDYRKKDLDGDGVVDFYFIDRDFNKSFETVIERSTLPKEAQRRLVICVDSVPYTLMAELWRDGHFRDFHHPSRLISAFPSDTNPAMTEIFGTEKTPGVEDRHYDREEHRIVGGKWDHMVRKNRSTDTSFHRVFDYEEHPRYGALMYVAPYLVSDHDLKQCRKAFWRCYISKPPDEPIMLYVGSTDAITHKCGREGLERQLLRLEGMLDEIICATGGALRISLFSDHGNNLVNSDTMIDLESHLGRHGFRLATALTKEGDVVVPRFGLVGDVCLYTDKENRAPLAEALKSLEGVDFALYEKGGESFVVSARGKAKIGRLDDRYRYQPIEGDPLGLAEALKELDDYENLDADGFADDDLWFRALEGHDYPDILKRAMDAMTNHVVNRPDVVLSLKDGFCYGSGAFGKLINLLGTHGSANAAQSLGMVMSTAGPLPDYVRGADLLGLLDVKKSELVPTEMPTMQMSPSSTPTPTAPAVTVTPAETPTEQMSPAPVPSETPTAQMSPAPKMSPAPQMSPSSTPTPTAPAPTAPTAMSTPAITPTATPEKPPV
jgi:hypothetical protein